ncbi:hypothetical protein TNCV_3008421 [Trichonephila clavipes]|nr:hypothetical protein TNCV_3008421 [Trichonephila clavipes]
MCLCGISGFQGEGTVWKTTNVLGARVKSFQEETHFASVVQAKMENLSPKGSSKNVVPEQLPAMTAPNAEVCEC